MKIKLTAFLILFLTCICGITAIQARDLGDIQKEGILHHLGVPYANFVAGDGRGLDVEVMQLFAKEIGVKYQYIETNWKNVINDLVGKQVRFDGDNVKLAGDVIANGLTILPWRQKALNFSAPTFPTQVWLISGPQSPLRPITPTGSIDKDIAAVKVLLPGKTVLGKNNTCLDSKLYFLKDLNRALESTITVCSNAWKYVAEVDTDFDPKLPMINCLPDQLNQAILNLIINCAHAIEESGTALPPPNEGTTFILRLPIEATVKDEEKA